MQLYGAFQRVIEQFKDHSRFAHLSGALGEDVVQVHVLLSAHASFHMRTRDGEGLVCGGKIIGAVIHIPIRAA